MDQMMFDATGHQSYRNIRMGQSFELAFPLPDGDSVGVYYDEIVAKGAVPVKAPEVMPWGRVTAFFADPDGNIHELYSLRDGEAI